MSKLVFMLSTSVQLVLYNVPCTCIAYYRYNSTIMQYWYADTFYELVHE